MFGKKNKKNTTTEDVLATKVNQDMVVRNMPSMARLSGVKAPAQEITSSTESHNLSRLSPQTNNPKMIGLIIIIGGLIFIGGLVYLSYVYIIKPQTNKTIAPVTNIIPETKSIVNSPRATTSEEITIATTTMVATVTPEIFDIASSSTSTAISLDQIGRPNVDLPPLLDTDNDGLNDEEEMILGTNPNLADSNANTYEDLVEVNNNYNPAGSGKLNTNSGLATYSNKIYSYQILYPKEWPLNSLTNDSIITFTAPDDSIIQISVQENTDRQSILGWYGNSFPDTTITYDKLKSTDNLDGIFSSDNLNFYLTDKKKNNVYIISYVPAVDGRLAYPNIFSLMINSLILK